MPRAPSSGIASAILSLVSQPGYLIRFVTTAQPDYPSQTVYLCTLDVESNYDPGDGAHIWVPYDAQIQGANWAVGAGAAARMVLGDADLAWWTLALYFCLQDAPIDIWQCYADAPDEAEPLWRGRIGAVAKEEMSVVCDLVQDTATMHAPRRRVQSLVAARYLLPAGRVIMVGSQKWVLERK